MVLARIKEQPAAVVALTLADLLEQLAGNQQVRCGTRDRAECIVQGASFTPPLPAKSLLVRRYPQPREASFQFRVQFGEITAQGFLLLG